MLSLLRNSFFLLKYIFRRIGNFLFMLNLGTFLFLLGTFRERDVLRRLRTFFLLGASRERSMLLRLRHFFLMLRDLFLWLRHLFLLLWTHRGRNLLLRMRIYNRGRVILSEASVYKKLG